MELLSTSKDDAVAQASKKGNRKSAALLWWEKAALFRPKRRQCSNAQATAHQLTMPGKKINPASKYVNRELPMFAGFKGQRTRPNCQDFAHYGKYKRAQRWPFLMVDLRLIRGNGNKPWKFKRDGNTERHLTPRNLYEAVSKKESSINNRLAFKYMSSLHKALSPWLFNFICR